VARQGPPLRPLIAILVACGLLLAGVLPGVSAVLRGAGGQGDLFVAGATFAARPTPAA
jgi:hypothetical protein